MSKNRAAGRERSWRNEKAAEGKFQERSTGKGNENVGRKRPEYSVRADRLDRLMSAY